MGAPGGAPNCFTERFGGGDHSAAFASAFVFARDLIDRHKPDLIALEEAFARGGRDTGSALKLTFGLRSVILTVARIRGVPTVEFAVSTIDKHFLGHRQTAGRKRRKLAVADRCRQLGWRCEDEDQADACAVWDLACSRINRDHAVVTAPIFGRRVT